MKVVRQLGTMRPDDGPEVGARIEADGDERLLCLWIQGLSVQQGTVGTFFSEKEARTLMGWIREFLASRKSAQR